MFGVPQLAALLILLQRGLEELYSAHNTKKLLDRGAKESGQSFYPVVAVTHLGWIAGLFFIIPADAPTYWPLIAAYLILQGVRYWVIANLGPYWTHRIITLPGDPLVRRGPYKYLRHPNYVITLIETALLPLAFGAWAFAAIMTAIWAVVLRYKIELEDAALDERRDIAASPKKLMDA
jgi:methyltransferase